MGYQSTSILTLLEDAIVAQLLEDLQAEVVDETEALLLRAGKLQADPTDAGINILIHDGGEEWPDELYLEQKGIVAPTYEIGGGDYWMRRFWIELKLFFDGEDLRTPPREKAHIIMSRAQASLRHMEVSETGPDSFGEQWERGPQIRKVSLNEGGGEGTFIWRGKIWIEILTRAP